MKTKNKILVALDLEEQSMIALKYAEYFAELLDYELDVVTVVEESGIFTKLFNSDELILKLNKEIEEKVNNAIEPYVNKVKISKTIAHGKPYEKIVAHAKATNPSIIFMGKSELPKYKRAFLGSNSMHVILESDFPVITIRGDYGFEKYTKEHKEILLPLDLNKGICEQLTAAIEFAQMLKTSIHAFSIQRSGGKAHETKMLSQLAQTKKTIIDAGVDCSIEIINEENKSVSDVICNLARERNSALLVIMTREESKITDLFMGSNARDIINNSDVPVLSIEPWDRESGSEIFSAFYDPLKVMNK